MDDADVRRLGPRTLRGEVRLTKGNSPVLDGVFLVLEGSRWADHAANRHEGLRGREVEVTGTFFRRPCRPGEQCPEGGYFDFLSEIVALDLLS